MKRHFVIAFLLAVVALSYSNTLVDSFTLDDKIYIDLNPQVTNASLRGLLAANESADVFRPLTFATLALNWKIGQRRPFGYHLFNLLLHGAATLMFYFLLEAIFLELSRGVPSPRDQLIAFAAALIFAVHPIHTEAVSSIVGRAEILAAGFVFAAWILHLKNRPIAALICFALALLSKESAVVFLPLILVGDYALGRWKPRISYALVTGLTLLYLAVLWKVQGGHLGRASINPLDNPLASLPAGWRVLNALRVGWKYVALHLYPAKLSCDYSFNAIPMYRDWGHTLPALFAALAVAAAWLVAIGKRKSTLILAGAIYLIGFATTANVLLPTGTIMGERLAYLPSAGFCLLIALGWIWLRDRQKLVALAALTAVVATFAMRTMVRNQDWRDNLSLFEAGVRAVPGSAKMHSGLGAQYLAEGRIDLAGPELEAALHIDKDYPDAMESYGLLQSMIGNYQGAGAMMERALNMSNRDNPNYDFMAVNFAAVLMQTGHQDAALDLLNREIRESPRYARAWANRAVIHYQQKETGPARADAKTALLLDPENKQAHNLMALLDGSAEAASSK